MMCNAGSTIACAASGSSVSISAVEPLRSANNAVTILRSPSRFSGAGVSATRISDSFDFFAEAAAKGALSAVPHSPQKRLPAGLSAPHCGQRFASAAPQSPQNFLPAGFSALQFEQRISFPALLRAQLVEQDLGLSEVRGVEALGEPAEDLREHRA